MSYFKKVKKGDKVFGLVFGLGVVKKVFDDGHYKLIAEFEDDTEIPYTDDGIPGWGKFNEQTLFFKNDIDLTEFDFSPISKILTPKKIIKLREKKRLEVRLPSGIWHTCNKLVKEYVREQLRKENFHLFRKKQK
ncbi:MAG: hypothetical protein U9R16_00555 [Campylobacterota bacterium]|nr:hypothetical protein [Campylobacterota bacterium]